MTFGEFLKQQRELKDWKQPAAAANIDIEQSYLSKLENNKAVPSTEVFERLMSAYGFTISQLNDAINNDELIKLREIVDVGQFIVSAKTQAESKKQRVLIMSIIMLMSGMFLIALGVAMKDHQEVVWVYESRGITAENENVSLFVEMPTHRDFRSEMEAIRIGIRSGTLKSHPLFPRLSYKQTTLDHFRGSFYDEKVQDGNRRYYEQTTKVIDRPVPFYLAFSIGCALLMGGIMLFSISKK
jgi:transcriptional regulator with XRE-family HTH domain